jgi:predicted enzyme related to lactoylglutathione lyase
MPVGGIGGLFFRARDADALKQWYCEHLGVGCGDYGMWEQEAGTTVFSPFAADTDYFPADRQWMINFRVSDLDQLLTKLRDSGIEVITKDEWNDPSVGRFARIHDPEGNPIELWEPPTG